MPAEAILGSIIVGTVALGTGLLVFSIRKLTGKLRKFVMLTGVSLLGFPVFSLLHNLVYGLFIHFCGKDYWGNGDESFFFILAFIVCPLGFFVGVMGSIVFIIKGRKRLE